uniref:Uncharacterized protein n=1 Tax=Oryza punctata TaxID=4537 RepID=A0A0E0LA54_ORYPU
MVNGLSRQIKRGKAEYKFELKRREATCYGESSISEVVDVPFGGIQATMRFPQDPVQNLELQRGKHGGPHHLGILINCPGKGVFW